MIIFKYHLKEANAFNEILLPKESKVLSAQFQDNHLQLWVLHSTLKDGVSASDPGQEFVKRVFGVWGTGIDIPCALTKELKHISTVQDRGLVWHVFEHLGF